jgi:putative acid phosphatase of HAD superfamily subfamily IIIB
MHRGGKLNRLLRVLALVALGAILATTVAAIAQKKPLKPAKPQPSPAISIRPTGVGLPEIGEEGTVGASDLASALRSYHDGGQYESDLSTVDAQARSFMLRQAKALRQKRKRRCSGKQKSRTAAKCRSLKLALVLDIDETSLSNYNCLSAADFKQATVALAQCLAAASSPAVAPTKALYDRAQAKHVAVFFITGRPKSIPGVEQQTETNLKSAGYDKWQGLVLNPTLGGPTIPYKSGARADIEKQGYRIVLNVGDQESDLAGGHADRAFKLPNPFYFIG